MRNACILIILMLTLSTTIGTACAASPVEPVNLSADSLVMDQGTGLLRAEGNVRIEQGPLNVTAGSADWNQQSGEAVCSGGIRLESPDGVLTGDALSYDFTTGQGVLTNGDARLSAYSVYLTGEEIEKRGDVSYRVTGGSFTTCAGDRPAWKLTASRLDVDIEGYARAKHALFYLRNIPVLYLPYIALPAKSERQSGLLMPEFSHSTRLGYRYIQPYYQVFGDNMDATLSVDAMSDFGLGTGLEFRYLPQESRPGRLFGNYITGFDDEPDRSLVEWTHDGLLPGDIRLLADAEYVGKKDYYRIFGNEADVYASDKSISTLTLSRAWDKTVLATQTKYTRDLEQSSAPLLQYLPEVKLDVLPQRTGDSPLFLSLFAESGYLWQRDGLKGTRLRLRPTVSTDLLVTRAIEIVPAVSWLQREYRFDNLSEGEGLPIVSVSTGTRMARVFRLNGTSMTHLRHAVEPMLHYRYIPDVDQSHLPLLDGRDRVLAQNVLTFELMNRFTARFADADGESRFREIASLRFSVDYDIDEARRTAGPPPDENRPFSPARGELILRPTGNSFLRGDVAYDFDSAIQQVESWSALGGMHDRRGNGFVASYNYLRDDFDYFSGGVDVALLSPLYASYEQRYDLETHTKLEDIAQLEYRGTCWSLLVGYRDRFGEEEISFRFALGGISDNRLIRSVSQSLKNFF